MTQPDSIFLVDDDDAVRHALKLYLERENIVVHDFPSAEVLLENIASNNASLLVLDIRMEGMSGLELQTELKARHIDLPIIFITGHGNVQSSVSAMKQGAADFIEKPFENEKLLESIKYTFRKSKHNMALEAVKAELKKRFESLTSRERQVMEYVVDGVSNKQMAAQLGVSDRTIEVHRSRVMTKMSATSLPELVRMAVSLGINDTPR
jgi:two-component system, LuxR family, response regulator FixJ